MCKCKKTKSLKRGCHTHTHIHTHAHARTVVEILVVKKLGGQHHTEKDNFRSGKVQEKKVGVGKNEGHLVIRRRWMLSDLTTKLGFV